MAISSRTPEGMPHRCPICGQDAAIDPSFPSGDSTCPSCGHLLWWFRDRLSRTSGLSAEQIRLDSSFQDVFGADSLDVAELAMEIEQEFNITIPDDAAVQIRTVEDVIRYIIGRRGDAT